MEAGWLVFCVGTIAILRTSFAYRTPWVPGYNINFDRKYNGPPPHEVMVDYINRLGLKLLDIHNENNENNIALSPYGAASVLIAIAEGLRGDAALEIYHAAHIPHDLTIIRIGLRDIHRHLKSYFIPREGFLSGLTLSHENVTLSSSYEKILKFYGYDVDSFNSALYPDLNPTTTKPAVTGAPPSAGSTPMPETPVETIRPDEAPTTNGAREETTPPQEITRLTNSPVTIPVVEITTPVIVTEAPTTVRSISEVTTAAMTVAPATMQTTPQAETIPPATEIPEKVTEKEVSSTIASAESVSTNRVSSADLTSTDSTVTTPETSSTKQLTTTVITLKSDLTSTDSTVTTPETSTTKQLTTTVTTLKQETENVTDGTVTTTEEGKYASSTTRDDSGTTTSSPQLATTVTSDLTTTVTGDHTTTVVAPVNIARTISPINSSQNADVEAASRTKRSPEILAPLSAESSFISFNSKGGLSSAINTNADTKEMGHKKRSIIDYLIARYYDDFQDSRSANLTIPHRYHKTFLVNGKHGEGNIHFMTYDTVLPFYYIPNLDALALSFPLDSANYYLLLILPVHVDGIDSLICELKRTPDLKYIIENLKYTHVKAVIPSFMLKGFVNLTPTLQKLGIKQIFEPRRADFSPMTTQKDIYVTNIEQAITVTIKNYVDLGTMADHGDLHQYGPVEFVADHPFLYFVMDSHLHVTLMAGKIINPLNSRIR